MITETSIKIGHIPCLAVMPSDTVKAVILFYHGWSSSKEAQSLRARILAACGYAVIVPDALRHGQRGHADYTDELSYALFWEAVLTSLAEASQLAAYAQTKWPGVKRFAAGHSMGGITALGVVTAEEDIAGAVSMNGSGWWNESDRRFRAAWKISWQPFFAEMIGRINRADPYNRPEALRRKSVLLLNGGADDVVDNAAQAMYADRLSSEHIDAEHIVYDGLGHFVTTNMMGDAVAWLDRHI